MQDLYHQPYHYGINSLEEPVFCSDSWGLGALRMRASGAEILEFGVDGKPRPTAAGYRTPEHEAFVRVPGVPR